jgi:predicted Zn-dependent protease
MKIYWHLITISSLLIVLALFTSFKIKEKSHFTVALISLDGKNFKDMKKISKSLSLYYSCKVEILPSIETPQNCHKSDSDTLLASNVLKYVSELYKNAPYDKFMVVTERPIHFGMYGLIRGLASRVDEDYCIVSTNKIKLESNHNKKFYNYLLEKLSRHELGHTLGLMHCMSEIKCFMVYAVNETDKFYKTKNSLCENCFNKISILVK